jgi:hypothetical protein
MGESSHTVRQSKGWYYAFIPVNSSKWLMHFKWILQHWQWDSKFQTQVLLYISLLPSTLNPEFSHKLILLHNTHGESKQFYNNTARPCVEDPPTAWLGVDMDWPLKQRILGTTITYSCPFKTKTNLEELSGNLSLQNIKRFKIIIF